MKIIALGDIHGREDWKYVTETQQFDKIVFIGDYFDTHEDIPPIIQLNNFNEISQWIEKNKERAVALIGNHDFHYWPGCGGDTGTSGYQHSYAAAFYGNILPYEHLFKMAYSIENLLFSHAGISVEWLNDNGWDGDVENVADFVNKLFIANPKAFAFNGFDPTGNNTYQTPIWIRPASLIQANKQSPLKERWVQIFGHTAANKLVVGDNNPAEIGSKYFLIDTLNTSQEYLEWEDGVFSVKSLKP